MKQRDTFILVTLSLLLLFVSVAAMPSEYEKMVWESFLALNHFRADLDSLEDYT
jgi:hypothetical protein